MHTDSSRSRPRTTIGLPVRNGAVHIAHTIESLLNQTVSDFEIIVCDNASTDDTAAIVRRLALARYSCHCVSREC